MPVRPKQKKTSLLKLALAGVFCLGLLITTTPPAVAQFNQEINYQGRLQDSAGTAVADGDYTMVFNLYTQSTGGTAIWTESHSGASKVAVQGGLFSVMLGAITSLSSLDFNQVLYLGVTIEADGEMAPRKILGAVPAAFKANDANTVGGVASSSLVRNDTDGTVQATSTNTLFSLVQKGSGKVAEFFSGLTSVFTILNNGNVGIGTDAPTEKLHVAGNLRLDGMLRDSFGSIGMAGDVLQSTGTGVRWVAPTGGSASVLEPRDFFVYSSFDSTSPSTADPFLGATVGSGGTLAAGDAGALSSGQTTGVVALRPGTGANSGYYFKTIANGLVLSGDMTFEGIMQIATSTDTVVRLGFHDSITTVEPTDGVYFQLVGGDIVGRTSSNSVRSTTGTSYTPLAGGINWYKYRIQLNSSASTATFYIYNVDTGVALWSDTLSTNIPTTSARATAVGITVHTTATGTVRTLVNLDFMGYGKKAGYDKLTLGGASLWSRLGNDIFYNMGNVGIGTASPSPSYNLDVAGTARIGGAAVAPVNASLTVTHGATAVGLAIRKSVAGSYSYFEVFNEGGNSVFRLNESARLMIGAGMDTGIGRSGSGVLDILDNFGDLRDLRLRNLFVRGALNDRTDSSGLLGQVLMSTGTSTQWVATSTLGLGGASLWSQTGSNIHYTAGNVGIGTTTPSERLTIAGNLALASSSDKIYIAGAQMMYLPDQTAFVGSMFIGNGGGALTSGGSNNGKYNSALGVGALVANTTGFHNTAIGNNALSVNTTGQYNTAIGSSALLANTTGGNNAAIGPNVLFSNTTGSYNAAVGHNALYFNTTGAGNDAFGYGAMFTNTTGSNNTAIGYNALYANTTGSNNTVLGYRALQSNTTGSQNTAVGDYAGRYYGITGYDGNTTASSSIYLGTYTRAAANGNENEIVIGNYALGNGSNSVTLGNDSIIKTILRGSVGIGTTTPTAQLHTTGTVRFQNLGAGSLQTDSSGNVSVSSDLRLKNLITDSELFPDRDYPEGHYIDGLTAIRGLEPIAYQWKPESGLNQSDINIGFSAQNVMQFIPEAVGEDPRGFLTLSDRPILAALVNATKEQQVVLDALLGIGTSTATTTEGLLGQVGGESLWSKIIEVFADFKDGVFKILRTEKVETEELCIDDVCIDKVKLQQLLNGTAGNGGGGTSSSGGSPVVTPPPVVPPPAPEPPVDIGTGTTTANPPAVTPGDGVGNTGQGGNEGGTSGVTTTDLGAGGEGL